MGDDVVSKGRTVGEEKDTGTEKGWGTILAAGEVVEKA